MKAMIVYKDDGDRTQSYEKEMHGWSFETFSRAVINSGFAIYGELYDHYIPGHRIVRIWKVASK